MKIFFFLFMVVVYGGKILLKIGLLVVDEDIFFGKVLCIFGELML